MTTLYPILLAAHGDPVLWPPSVLPVPNQFQPLLRPHSGFQRLAGLVADPDRFHPMMVVVSQTFGHLAAQQLHACGAPVSHFICEPRHNGSAAGAAVAALIAHEADPEAVLLLLPARWDPGESRPFLAAVEAARMTSAASRAPAARGRAFEPGEAAPRGGAVPPGAIPGERPDEPVVLSARHLIEAVTRGAPQVMSAAARALQAAHVEGLVLRLAHTPPPAGPVLSYRQVLDRRGDVAGPPQEVAWVAAGHPTTADPATATAAPGGRIARPWGWYETVHKGPGYQVKQLTVSPGGLLSLQKHAHRAEHWVVVGGVADVHLNGVDHQLRADDSIHIPQGAVHRLGNSADTPLEVIEVQSGAYLGEDDIVRLDDIYARR